MHTTLDIADDVLAAAKELARREGRSAGAVVSELARRGLTLASNSDTMEQGGETFFGFRPFAPRSDVIVTNQLIDKLRDEGAY